MKMTKNENYVTPSVEVIEIVVEQAVLNGSYPNGGINDLEEENW